MMVISNVVARVIIRLIMSFYGFLGWGGVALQGERMVAPVLRLVELHLWLRADGLIILPEMYLGFHIVEFTLFWSYIVLVAVEVFFRLAAACPRAVALKLVVYRWFGFVALAYLID